jgi:hypothetical protein
MWPATSRLFAGQSTKNVGFLPMLKEMADEYRVI